MRLEIAEGLRKHLVERLAGALGTCRVSCGNSLGLDLYADLQKLDSALPAHGDSWVALRKAVSEQPFSDFVFSELSREMRDGGAFSKDPMQCLLSELKGFGDVTLVAEGLVSRFESLPWSYIVCIQLPLSREDLLGLSGEKLVVSDTLYLAVPDQEQREEWPFTGREALESLGAPWDVATAWAGNAYYLHQRVQGYIPRFGGGALLENCEYHAKAFLGLCLATNLMDYHRLGFVLDTQYHDEALIFRTDVSPGRKQESAHLPIDVSRLIRSLKVSVQGEKTAYLEVLRWIQDAFRNGAETQHLLLAANWYFDSLCGQNDLLAFVQATVCAEIILCHDKKRPNPGEAGVTELLANRCAYLIASSYRERMLILDDFRRIYGTRSDIVHRGKARLSREERSDLARLREFCARAILAELASLSR